MPNVMMMMEREERSKNKISYPGLWGVKKMVRCARAGQLEGNARLYDSEVHLFCVWFM